MAVEKLVSRKPFQGVWNIIRFNWHFYVLACIGMLLAGASILLLPPFWLPALLLLFFLIFGTISLSLLASWYIYDLSNLYTLDWLPNLQGKNILNIHAGFDETSTIIQNKKPLSLTICDFYNPSLHTEVSIKRARAAYPPFPGTLSVHTKKLPFSAQQFDCTLAIMSAHEIRNASERINFFKEMARVTKDSGKVYVTEHLRDINNFLVYTLGFLHFYSKSSWQKTFKKANLAIIEEIKITPFITTFVLEKHGNTF